MSDKKILCSAISIIALLLLGSTLAVNEAFAGSDPKTIGTLPPIKISKSASPSPVGLNPVQIGHAYGFDQLSCYGTSSCGSGQTIAIVDAYDDQILKVTWQHLALNMVFLLVLLLTVALRKLLHKVYQKLIQTGH